MNEFIYTIGVGVVGGACIFGYFYLCSLIPLLKTTTWLILAIFVLLLPVVSATALAYNSISKGDFLLALFQAVVSFLLMGWGWVFVWKERHDIYKDMLNKSNYRLWKD